MRPSLIVRLVFDFLTASLLLLVYAYDWLGNVAHEVVGTVLFMLLVTHNVFNGRWYGTLTKPLRSVRATATRTTTAVLLISMLGLLATSVIISQTVLDFLPFTSTFTVRQLHTLAAYLVLLIVGMHLGLQWPVIMGFARQRIGKRLNRSLRAWILRVGAFVIAARGLYSLVQHNVFSKLTMEMSIEFGAIDEPALVSVFDHFAIIGLCASLTYYASRFFNAGGAP